MGKLSVPIHKQRFYFRLSLSQDLGVVLLRLGLSGFFGSLRFMGKL